MPNYTDEHAKAGIAARLPGLETWPNQYPGYVITTRFPEYSSVCPKTGLPDYGTITIRYQPRKSCIERRIERYALRTVFMLSSNWMFALHPRQITTSRSRACLSQIGLAKLHRGQSTSTSNLSMLMSPSSFIPSLSMWMT